MHSSVNLFLVLSLLERTKELLHLQKGTYLRKLTLQSFYVSLKRTCMTFKVQVGVIEKVIYPVKKEWYLTLLLRLVLVFRTAHVRNAFPPSSWTTPYR